MKKFLFVLSLIALFAISSYASDIIIGGYFQGENLFILNPSSDNGFCVQEIQVNGKRAYIELRSNSLELDMSQFDMRRGDTVTITIKHKESCTPRILNEDALRPEPSFTITTINVDAKGILRWTSIEEQGKIPYKIETFRWGRWIVIGEVLGFGSPRSTDYQFDLNSNEKIKPHSGKNTYRVCQSNFKGKFRYSLEASYIPNGVQLATIVPDKKSSDKINFSVPTSFEVIDATGAIVSSGFGPSADISKVSGIYFVNFDSSTAKLKKK